MKVLKTKILENNTVTEKIYKLTVEFYEDINPGQFFMIKTLDNSFLLPRPISVHDYNENKVSFLYRAEGIGTKRISNMRSEDEIQLFGPLGNGFNINELQGKVAIVGGGIGTAPLLYLTKVLGKKADVYLGFKDCVYKVDEFKRYANKTVIVTDDGSVGEKGFITDFIDYSNYDAVVSCGPEVMMSKVVHSCKENKVKCYVSLERRMACGMGVCLGCTVVTVDGNKRACKDGPVFSSEKLV